MNKIYKPCNKCHGTGKIKIRGDRLLTPDTRKMIAIMNRNGLTQLALAKHLDISQATVSGWFKASSNIKGKIKKIYFESLKSKGFK